MPDNMMRIAGRGHDGTAKAVRTNEKGNIIMSKGLSYKYVDKPSLNITTQTQEIHTTFSPSIIDSISYLADNHRASILIGIRDSDGQQKYLTVFRANNFATGANITFERLQETDMVYGGYSDYMELVNYNDEHDRYIMRNRGQIEAPHGFRIVVSSQEPCNGTMSIGYYEEV